jgi:gas vesicle protein
MRNETTGCERGSGPWLLLFLFGGLVGAAAALVLAPKTGRQTRQRIREVALEAKERAGDYYGQTRNRMFSAVQKGVDTFQQRKADESAAREWSSNEGSEL